MKLTPTHIESARRHLRAADPVMKTIIDAVGPHTLLISCLGLCVITGEFLTGNYRVRAIHSALDIGVAFFVSRTFVY